MKTTHCSIGISTRDTWIIAAIVTQALLGGNKLFALPTNGEVTAGKATITTPTASKMLIGQGSNHTIINWNSFGIGKGETVNISQPTPHSTLLNRVIGNDPSSIFGTLTANGRLFLINPNGMMFAPGATVNVGGLVASTLSINNADFLAEKYVFHHNNTKSSLVNEGSLTGDFVALFGNDITNKGNIVATKGSTSLAAGNAIILDLDTSGLVAIKVEESDYNARVTNSGVIEGNGGTIFMKTSVANELLGSVVNNSGVIRATSITEREGNIVIEGASIVNTGTLSASDINAHGNNLLDAGRWSADGSAKAGTIQIDATGNIEQTADSHITADGNIGGDIRIEAGNGIYLSGTLSATGISGKGGQIAITAPQTLLAGALVKTDGLTGGGNILIGGGWQGNDASLANAVTTTVTNSSRLTANALENGNGGTVVIWSDQATNFAGSIEAKGGSISGNGGKVEVSGHENLAMAGGVITTAPNGENGLLLLDPRNITIDANASAQLFSVIPLLDPDPAAGDQHGSGNIVELQNGNIVVASPLDDFVATDAGAVRLYKPDGTLLSTLIGSTANDQVGEKVITLTGNSNAVTMSRKWSNAGLANVGAVTWIDGNRGTSGSVSESNSLIGSSLNDAALSTLTPLANGHYVVASPGWDNGTIVNAGATTWGDGGKGTIGVTSALNSLVGSKTNDGELSKVIALSNGHYVIGSPNWDNGTATNVGAVTWANGAGGTVGAISSTNSLVGSNIGDNVGLVLTPLTNGSYVVGSPNWDNGSITNGGAATWVNGNIGATGALNTANSLVGSSPNDKVGTAIFALSNGNYVISSPTWDHGTIVDAGAITWGNGTIGSIGTVNTTNSLIGSATNDCLSSTVMALTNGNYVVGSPNWDNGVMINAGALTWGDGVNGTVGVISDSNSLVGSTANDGIAYTMAPLTNGNYVVGSSHWDNGTIIDAGAVIWGNGSGSTVGIISATNSLVGSTTNDGALYTITPLTNGNYVIGSPNWDNSSIIDAGAVTWGNGSGGTVGTISATNSLIGSIKNDFTKPDNTGSNTITALKNGNYVVSSPGWDRGSATNAGAVTWGNGVGGTVGEINVTNSLVGTKTGDQVGSITTALPNGNYVVGSSNWDNGSISNAGAVTVGNGVSALLVGTISSANSITGSKKDDFISSSGITPLTVGNMNGSFIVSSMNCSTNSGRVDIVAPQVAEAAVQQEYNTNPGADNTFTPAQITALLDTGNNLILKANNNLTINSAIVANNPLGNGGNLEMHAGQSLFLNADITTDNGNLTLIANDKLANGVVDAMRSAGNAVITMATGTSIDTGTGNVTIELRDGAGLTNRESGDITLRNINAGTINAVNYGQTAGSGITLSGTLAATATNGTSIILAGQDFDNNTGSILSTAGTARWLIYSDNPGATNKGGLTSAFRHYNSNYTGYAPTSVIESGNGFIYDSSPGQISVNTTLASGTSSGYYGDQPDATYGYTLTNFADNEDNAQNIGLTGTMNVSGTPTATSNTGTYPILYAGGLSSSVGFTFTSGSGITYTVEPKPIDITADPNNKTYGSADPSLTWSAETPTNGRGLIPGDLFTGELSREPGENVSNYAIHQNTLDNSNYDINYTGAYLTIHQRPITLSAVAVNTIYGEADPALAVNITAGTLGSSSVNDSISDVTGSLIRQTGMNVGSYNINLGSGAKAGNYAITFDNSNKAFSIDPRPVNVAANALTKTYGNSDPALTWSTESQSTGRGLLAGDSFNGALSRSAGENVRAENYAITQNTLENSNYAINFTGNSLNIQPRPITLNPLAATKPYGEPDPALAVTITNGSLGSITVTDALSDITGTLNRQTGSTPGIYDIALGSGNKSGNYEITYTADNNAFTITRRPINIMANALSKIYGDADPALTWLAESPLITQSAASQLIALNALSSNNPDNGALSLTPVTKNLLVLNSSSQSPATGSQYLNNTSTGFTAANPIVVAEPAGALFAISLPEEMFTHNNPDAVIAFEVGSVNGSSIPPWMSFDPDQKVISGTPPDDAIGDYLVEVIAKDQFGGEIRTTVMVKVG